MYSIGFGYQTGLKLEFSMAAPCCHPGDKISRLMLLLLLKSTTMLRKEARRKQPEYKYVEKESTNKLKQPKNTQMSITLHQIYAVDSNRRYTNGYYRSHFAQRQNAI